MVGWLAGWWVGWLVGWLAGWLVDGLVGWLVGWWVGWLVGWLAGWWVGGWVGWLVGLFAGWLVGWWVGWLVGWWVDWLVGCLTSQQHASVSQARICSDKCACCHIETEVTDQTFYFTRSQYTDTGQTNLGADAISPGRVATGVPTSKSLV